MDRKFVCEINANDNKITNVIDPTDPQDAATKKYVDDNAGGLDPSSAILILGIWDPGPLLVFGFNGGSWVS